MNREQAIKQMTDDLAYLVKNTKTPKNVLIQKQNAINSIIEEFQFLDDKDFEQCVLLTVQQAKIEELQNRVDKLIGLLLLMNMRFDIIKKYVFLYSLEEIEQLVKFNANSENRDNGIISGDMRILNIETAHNLSKINA